MRRSTGFDWPPNQRWDGAPHRERVDSCRRHRVELAGVGDEFLGPQLTHEDALLLHDLAALRELDTEGFELDVVPPGRHHEANTTPVSTSTSAACLASRAACR